MQAPYLVPMTVTNYAVQASFRGHDPAIFVRGDGANTCNSDGLDGVCAYIDAAAGTATLGYNGVFSPNSTGQSGTVLSSGSFTWDNNWHTVRVEVRGDSMQFLIDGRVVASGQISADGQNQHVGIAQIGNPSELSGNDFTVYALP